MKFIPLTPALYRYVCDQRSDRHDRVLARLRATTHGLGAVRRMQIGPDQGAFLTLLVRVAGVRRALEVGTFTGYSAICIARGLSPGGRLTCIDRSGEWTDIARRFWRQAGMANRIRLQLGDALELLARLPLRPQFDFAFIDAAKEEYDKYYELVLPRLRRGSLILFDNMLWGGRVVKKRIADPGGRSIARLNRKLR